MKAPWLCFGCIATPPGFHQLEADALLPLANDARARYPADTFPAQRLLLRAALCPWTAAVRARWLLCWSL